jgi:nucleotide-binding universal stress UspA family protein
MSETTAAKPSRIVVGVDGSDSAQAALLWAVRQAKLTGARVEAVTAWHYESLSGWEPVGIDVDFEAIAKQIMSDALSTLAGLEPDAGVTARVAEGYPVEVLLDASQGAGMLVVGRRGHGRVTSLLIGSVSLHCVLHAHCPVLVLEPGT